ncbi:MULTISPECIES: NAD(P)/FAD-dependent oxidoreductase [Kribbella]|nr:MULTISPECIES: FAD-dependent oxidoreductase [Kribbella]
MYDVVVVGGGPAGTATALRLASTGRSVALLERSHFDHPRVGETLAPAVQPLLRELGVWDRYCALRPLPSWGTRSIWDDPEPAEHSHLASGYASGWHVDRRAFDRMLADAAADAGTDVLMRTSLVNCRYDGAAWNVVCSGERRLAARLVVDATGRSAVLGRSLGARRLAFDRLVGITAQWHGVNVTDEQYLLVEAAADGWWYTAPLPGGAMVGMLMTDADLCRRDRLASAGPWHNRLFATTATAERIGPRSASSALLVYPAASRRTTRLHDVRPWLAVGDAALSVDPISGSGVQRALQTAAGAADTLIGLLDRPGDAATLITQYESARDTECTTYLIERAHYYNAVRRYPTPFWNRRKLHAAA